MAQVAKPSKRMDAALYAGIDGLLYAADNGVFYCRNYKAAIKLFHRFGIQTCVCSLSYINTHHQQKILTHVIPHTCDMICVRREVGPPICSIEIPKVKRSVQVWRDEPFDLV